MGKPTRLLVDPNDPQSIVQQQEEITKAVDGEISFGDPSDPNDLQSVTPLAGDAAASHPGVLQNMEGAWAEALVEDLHTPVTFHHNLGVPVTTVSAINQPNVRWLNFMWSHIGIPTGTGVATEGLGVWERIRRHTVSGGAVGSITFTGLNGSTDKQYRITTEWVLNSANNVTMLMQANGVTTTYQTQSILAYNGVIIAGSAATNGFQVCRSGTLVAAGEKLVGETTLFADVDGKFRQSSSKYVIDQANMGFDNAMSHWTNTATNITSLKFVDSGGGTEFGNGTKIEIWRPQRGDTLSRDSALSACYTITDSALITENAFPLRFYAGGNRRIEADPFAVKASFFFIPAVR